MDNDIKKAFGLPIIITGFGDGKERVLYPFKMKEVVKFFELLNKVNIENLLINYIINEDGIHLKELFTFLFKDNPIEDFDENINVSNFKPIMKQILDELGLETGESKNVERE